MEAMQVTKEQVDLQYRCRWSAVPMRVAVRGQMFALLYVVKV